jgi:hypothetical protein
MITNFNIFLLWLELLSPGIQKNPLLCTPPRPQHFENSIDHIVGKRENVTLVIQIQFAFDLEQVKDIHLWTKGEEKAI